ncbi:MAG TPA: hypothetical protein VHH90_02220 [Polyangia bacterium]|nr:hypothetical protein [Polyangia bacterium]
MNSATEDVFIFYFDIVDFVDAVARDQEVLDRLLRFQRAVRGTPLGIGEPWTTVVTFADNVWARISSAELAPESKILDLAAAAMKSAREHGFASYFGVATKGPYTHWDEDKTLVGSVSEPTHILRQHIDSTSEPHIRAALAEKWSAKLKRKDRLPVPQPCVWIDEEIDDADVLRVEVPDHGLVVLAETFDLQACDVGTKWPYDGKGRFTPVGLRD